MRVSERIPSKSLEEGRSTAPASPPRELMPTGGADRSSESVGPPPGPFERLVQIVRANEQLFRELQRVATQLARARAYLTRPGCRTALGVLAWERAKTKHAVVLARLRANRIEALQILKSPHRSGSA